MNFLSILKTIEAAGVVAGPIVSMYNPAAGSVLSTIFRAVNQAETIPGLAGAGKKTVAQDQIKAELLAEVNATLAAEGKTVKATPELIELVLSHSSGAVDAIVAANKAVAEINAAVEAALAAQA